MTTTPTLEPAGVVFAAATRITQLDADGNVIPGSSVFVTEQLMKATITPVNEAGNTGAIFNAAGNLGVFYLNGDIPKWYTVAIEMVYPDPQIEALLTGGMLYSDSTAALGTPSSAPTLVGETSEGTLAAGQYEYSYAYFSVFGRTLPSPGATITTTGSTGSVRVTPLAVPSGALGAVVYGRYVGQLQAIGVVPNIGSQATSAASGTGEVTSLAVTALTEIIPAGTQFVIAGDTNSPTIVFTATETGAIGADELAVTTSASITTTIAAAAITAIFLDTGAAKPSGVPNTSDLSGGPGIGVGQQAPAPGVVANPNGVSLEFFMKRYEDGHQATDYPYFWFVLPMVKYFVVGARDVTNAELQALYTGTAFPNPNWGAGPSGQWPEDSSEILQWVVCGEDVVPTPSYVAQVAGS
jgi:hypothetical protein